MSLADVVTDSTDSSATPPNTSTLILDLPDDVLLVIFKEINCCDLINVVCNVCQRWQNLALHHTVWVNRHIKAKDIGGVILRKILTSIPVLDTLDLSHTYVEESTLKSLLTSKTRIINLKLSDCTIDSKYYKVAVKALQYLSKNLQVLSIELNDVFISTRDEDNLFGNLCNLRELTLIGRIHLEENVKKLNLDLPELEYLNLQRFEIRTFTYSDIRRYTFISNLINGKKAFLRTLYLPEYCHKTILKSVITCDFLTTISLPLEYVGVVSNLPFIENLKIQCDSSGTPPATWFRPKNLKTLELLLRKPNDDCIRFLQSINAENLKLISDNLCRELEKFYNDGMKRLTLRCFFLRLRHLTIKILREEALPQLKYLDVRGCFLGNGIPPKILFALKNRFPSLLVISDRFTDYVKKREVRYVVDCHVQESTDCSDTE